MMKMVYVYHMGLLLLKENSYTIIKIRPWVSQMLSPIYALFWGNLFVQKGPQWSAFRAKILNALNRCQWSITFTQSCCVASGCAASQSEALQITYSYDMDINMGFIFAITCINIMVMYLRQGYTITRKWRRISGVYIITCYHTRAFAIKIYFYVKESLYL